ncbi:hypothetical protein BCR34DRAFT_571529 [Clohesyomyces aquaticus]|uniref:Uncharacterized protein n=1 Tax=Clohesyomyces aquaticus TaxID=1231657 RepID=A0A1Y1Z8J9_9PLEO|nr:hypothetical protein BCR34DRAFT_571529 [Clohesyomyces aquaticus]
MSTDDNLPWTTTRCNRLLRPLSSRLTTLRKELEQRRKALGETFSASAVLTKASPRRPTSSHGKRAKPRGFDKTLDPDWAPGTKPGAASKKTYGGRGLKKAIAPQPTVAEKLIIARPGEIALATPFIARNKRRLRDSPQLQGSPSKNATRKRGSVVAKVEQIQLLKSKMTPDMWKLVNGLFDAYANLLEATKSGEKRSRKGTRSLMSACLREMPKYIALEEHFVRQDEEEADESEERDVTAEVYTWLQEEFGTNVGQGWRHFRQIVRAHGTALLCDAFADQILGLETLEAVVSLCMKVSAWDEVEKLMWTFLPMLKPLPIPTNLHSDMFSRQTSVYVSMLRDFVNVSQRYQFLYDQLEYMVSQELLPVEWLATVCMGPIWTKIVSALSDGDHRTYSNAFNFLETAVCIGAGLQDDSILEYEHDELPSKPTKVSSSRALREALDTTFSSLFTLLSGITLARHAGAEHDDEATVHEVTWVLDSLAIGLLKRTNIRGELERLSPDEDRLPAYARRALWSLAAPFLIRLEGCRSHPGTLSIHLSALVCGFHWVISQYSLKNHNFMHILETLPEFVSSIARCSGRPRNDDGFDQLQRLVDGMLSIKGLQSTHEGWSLARLALDSAMEYAQSTNNPQRMAYARRIETLLTRKGRVMLNSSHPSNLSPSARAGFRWEEGMGEWVACTPFVKQAIQPVPKRQMRRLELLPTPTPEPEGSGVGSAVEKGSQEREEREHLLEDITMYDDTPPQSSPVMYTTSAEPARIQRKRAFAVVIPSKNPSSSKRPCLSLGSEDEIQSDPQPMTKRGRPRRTLKQPGVLTPESDDLQQKSYSTSQPRRSHRTLRQLAEKVDSKARASRSRTSLQNDYRRSKQNDSDDEFDSVDADADELAQSVKKSRKERWAEWASEKRIPTKNYWVVVPGDESEDELSFQ